MAVHKLFILILSVATCYLDLLDTNNSISGGSAYRVLDPFMLRLNTSSLSQSTVCKADKVKSDHLCWPPSDNGSDAPTNLFSKGNHNPRLRSRAWSVYSGKSSRCAATWDRSSRDSWSDSWGGSVNSLSSLFQPIWDSFGFLKGKVSPCSYMDMVNIHCQ